MTRRERLYLLLVIAFYPSAVVYVWREGLSFRCAPSKSAGVPPRGRRWPPSSAY